MPIRRIIGGAALVVGAVACQDSATTAPALDLTTLVPNGGTQLVLQQEAGPQPGTTTFVLRVISRRSDLAAYQGTVRFAADAFELVGTATPTGEDGEMFLANPQIAEGRIRFAAFTTESFSTDEAFRFTVRGLDDVSAAKFEASLDVAGVVGGAALQAAELRAMDGVRDANGHLIAK